MEPRSRPLRTPRGVDLLIAHLAVLDGDIPSARDQLEQAIGVQGAAFLVKALTANGTGNQRRYA